MLSMIRIKGVSSTVQEIKRYPDVRNTGGKIPVLIGKLPIFLSPRFLANTASATDGSGGTFPQENITATSTGNRSESTRVHNAVLAKRYPHHFTCISSLNPYITPTM